MTIYPPSALASFIIPQSKDLSSIFSMQMSFRNMRSFRTLDLSLRLTVLPLTVASLWLMATDNQASDAYGKVEFSDISGFKYLVSMNAMAFIYAAASVLISSCLGRFDAHWLFFVLDQAVAYLMVTSGAAATEVVYLAYEGDERASWSEACSYYGEFCNKAKVSLSLHMVAFACFMALSLVSAYRVFCKFEAPRPPPPAPSSNSKAGEEQVE
ncbi:CASP-like protein 2D1 [Zingiber officinale]|uniref:CASP-like protein 2D1 n=1 Tax=Zingiber officinale TaxID=94328 RepID=UPI001C4ACCEE|nr:CASP-like protein 2D1 [Zingiber officinale]